MTRLATALPLLATLVLAACSTVDAPRSLALLGGELYIANSGGNRLWSYDLGTRQMRLEAGSGMLAVVEQYPNLKADQQYTNFQREYTAIENSIRSETVYYNEAAQDYNTTIKTFPNNILANFTNFKEKPYFKADAGAQKAPEVFTN